MTLASHITDPARLVLGAAEPPTVLTRPGRWPVLDDPVERMMYLDTMTYLPDDILTKVDRATMASSLEARLPFLDPDVAAFAWRLPPDLKMRAGTGKWLLRRLLHRYVPAAARRTTQGRLRHPPRRLAAGPPAPVGRGPSRRRGACEREGYLDARRSSALWAEHLAGAPTTPTSCGTCSCSRRGSLRPPRRCSRLPRGDPGAGRTQVAWRG